MALLDIGRYLQGLTSTLCLLACSAASAARFFVPSTALGGMTQWQDPEAFVPERFLEGTAAAAARPAHGWIPFGDGARGCPGAKFGTEEAILTLVRSP